MKRLMSAALMSAGLLLATACGDDGDSSSNEQAAAREVLESAYKAQGSPDADGDCSSIEFGANWSLDEFEEAARISFKNSLGTQVPQSVVDQSAATDMRAIASVLEQTPSGGQAKYFDEMCPRFFDEASIKGVGEVEVKHSVLAGGYAMCTIPSMTGTTSIPNPGDPMVVAALKYLCPQFAE